MASIPDDRWRLSYDHLDYHDLKTILIEAKRHIPKGRRGSNLAWLRGSVARMDCGMMHKKYNQCPVNPLLIFLNARGLTLSHPITKARLSQALEHDDAYSHFHHFFDLAPEMRLLIYKFAFNIVGVVDGDRKEFDIPIQPAVTRVCRLIRKETLPLYYSTTTFPLTACTKSWDGITPRPQLDLGSHIFLNAISDADFRTIRHLNVFFNWSQVRRPSYLYGRSITSRAQIAAMDGNLVTNVANANNTTGVDPQHAVAGCQLMEQAVRDLVASDSYRSGPRFASWYKTTIATLVTFIPSPQPTTFGRLLVWPMVFMFELEIV